MAKVVDKKPNGMSKRSWENAKMKPAGALDAPEAVAMLKKFKGTKFDQSRCA